MFRLIMTLFISCGLSGAVFANSNAGVFSNHLHSDILISPAQIYHHRGVQTDVSMPLDFLSNDDLSGSELSAWSLGAKVTSMYLIRRSPLRLGVDLDYKAFTWKTKSSRSLEENDAVDVGLTPRASFAIKDFVLGVDTPILFGSKEVTYNNRDENHEYISFLVRPAVVYSVDAVEVGAIFQTGINQEADPKNGQLGKEIASEFTLHGRLKLDEYLTVGGFFDYEWTSGVATATDNRVGVSATAEYDLGKAKFEGLFGYHTSAYKSKPVAAADIAFVDFALGGDYWINNLASIGGQLRVEYGSSSANPDQDLSRSLLSLGLRGNYLF